MPWNWQLPNWPHFTYDPAQMAELESRFLLQVGAAQAYLSTVEQPDYHRFIVEILSVEGQQSSKIEGELLDRESLQSSIRKCFGLDARRGREKEAPMAQVLFSVYQTFAEPLSSEMICRWHQTLFHQATHIEAIGQYRTHEDPMQIVSHKYGDARVFFEAPPSRKVKGEMAAFIAWFNQMSGPLLTKAALAHFYFESIHPFEDGNGRIGRLISEKALSSGVGRPVLIAVSKVLEKRKKEYYAKLEKCNRTLEVGEWVVFFGQVVLQAQEESLEELYFLIKKTKLLAAVSPQLNERQMKVLLRMLAEGPAGFQGGMSAEKYIAIVKTSRATATRDLAGLVEVGALVKTGELRYSRYHLNF